MSTLHPLVVALPALRLRCRTIFELRHGCEDRAATIFVLDLRIVLAFLIEKALGHRFSSVMCCSIAGTFQLGDGGLLALLRTLPSRTVGRHRGASSPIWRIAPVGLVSWTRWTAEMGQKGLREKRGSERSVNHRLLSTHAVDEVVPRFESCEQIEERHNQRWTGWPLQTGGRSVSSVAERPPKGRPFPTRRPLLAAEPFD